MLALLALGPFPLVLAAPELVLGGPVDALEVGGDQIAVVQGRTVRVLAGDGQPLRSLGRPDAPARARASPERPRDDVLERYGLAEGDRESSLTEALVEDESGPGERRRPAEAAAAPDRPLIAGGGEALWALGGGSLYRLDQGLRVRALSADRLAADRGGWLAVAVGARIWRSRDGGVTLDLFADAAGPVRGLAAAGGRIAWATDGALAFRGQGHAGALVLPAPLLDLRFCGSTLLALHTRGLLAVDPDGAVSTVEVPPPARRLGCGADGAWWLAGGKLWTSADRGRHFTEADTGGLPVASVATTSQGIWLGSSLGLYLLGPHAGSAPLLAPSAALESRRARAGLSHLLPRLVLTASETHRAIVGDRRDDLRLFAFADFPLEPPRRADAATAPTPAEVGVRLPPVDPGCLGEARAAAVGRALAEPERARAYIERARHAAWLPELRVRLERHLGRSESLNLPAGSVSLSGPLGLDSANDVRYEARATWDLSRLVFSSDEIAAEAQALRMADVRRELESLVNRLYFERRRLMLDAELTPEPATRTRGLVRAEEIDAELSALTGGALERCGR